MNSKTWSSVHWGPPLKSYYSQNVNRSIARQEGEVPTDLAGPFCHPDVLVKRSVETGKVINHSGRISIVNVRSQKIELAKKELFKPCLRT